MNVHQKQTKKGYVTDPIWKPRRPLSFCFPPVMRQAALHYYILAKMFCLAKGVKWWVKWPWMGRLWNHKNGRWRKFRVVCGIGSQMYSKICLHLGVREWAHCKSCKTCRLSVIGNVLICSCGPSRYSITHLWGQTQSETARVVSWCLETFNIISKKQIKSLIWHHSIPIRVTLNEKNMQFQALVRI
jgi:hypothetical protein